MSASANVEMLATDKIAWQLGPFHPALPGPLGLRLQLDGERIVGCEWQRGFCGRNLEKTVEGQLWCGTVVVAGRVDPENALFGEWAFVEAVEKLSGIDVPARAQWIRLIIGELARVSNHLRFAARMAQAVRCETVFHYLLRDREKFLDLFELVTGARFGHHYVRFGGVSQDITDGFVERALEVCDEMRLRIQEYNDLFTYHHAFLMRTTYAGVLPGALALDLGVSGPNVRASGVSRDERMRPDNERFTEIGFLPQLGTGDYGIPGDVHSRFVIRLREAQQSLDLVREATLRMKPGAFWNDLGLGLWIIPPEGEGTAFVESPRGSLGCHVISSGGSQPERVHFITPSTFSLVTVPDVLLGCRLEDLGVILASLDLSMAEVDR